MYGYFMYVSPPSLCRNDSIVLLLDIAATSMNGKIQAQIKLKSAPFIKIDFVSKNSVELNNNKINCIL